MDSYVARQPIFDIKQDVFAYELLYRSSLNNSYPWLDGDRATAGVISNSFLLIGFDKLTRGKKAFINFTRNLLEDGVATLLPSETTVIEILEDIEPDEKILSICRELKKSGYLLALDDFTYDRKYVPLVELADIIKIDFQNTSIYERKAIIDRIGHKKTKFLAEKVETREDFIGALKMGYSYFQRT